MSAHTHTIVVSGEWQACREKENLIGLVQIQTKSMWKKQPTPVCVRMKPTTTGCLFTHVQKSKDNELMGRYISSTRQARKRFLFVRLIAIQRRIYVCI